MKRLVGITLPEDLWTEAQKKAIDQKISKSEFVENALKAYLGGFRDG